jgi:sugar phosphate permease
MSLLLITRIITTFIFAVLGVLLSHKFPLPKRTFVWVLLILSAIIMGFTGSNVRLVAIFGFAIYLNCCLQGLVLGVLVGLFYRWSNRSSIKYL